MSQAVKISSTEMEHLREAASLNNRSLSGQAEHWMRIGRAIERYPDFSYAKIEQALRGLLSPDDLTGEEQEEFFDRFADATLEPSPAEDEFWAQRRSKGLGVGMDEAGNLVYGASRKS